MTQLNDSIILLRRAANNLKPGGGGFDELVHILQETNSRRHRIRNREIEIQRQRVVEGTWDDDDGEDELRQLWSENWALIAELEEFEEGFRKMPLGKGSKKMREKVYYLLWLSRIAYYGIR